MRITLNHNDIVGIIQERFRYTLGPESHPEITIMTSDEEVIDDLEIVIDFFASPFGPDQTANAAAGAQAANNKTSVFISGPLLNTPGSISANTEEHPRRRGRPRGSKNKATLAALNGTDNSGDNNHNDMSDDTSDTPVEFDDNDDVVGETVDDNAKVNETLQQADYANAGVISHPDLNTDPIETVEEPAPTVPSAAPENPFARLKTIAPPQILPSAEPEGDEIEPAAKPVMSPFNPKTESLFRAGNAPITAPAAQASSEDGVQEPQEASESASEQVPAPVPAQTRSLFQSIHQMAQKRGANGSNSTVNFTRRS